MEQLNAPAPTQTCDAARKLFEELDVIFDGAHDGITNMALDERLFHTVTKPTLRFYTWSEPTVSIGYFSRLDDALTMARGLPIVRRGTGGGLVFHGTGEDLTYSLSIPQTELPLSSTHIYRSVHAALIIALDEIGVNGCRLQEAGTSPGPTCFQNPVRDDVVREGRKIAGAAQRRTRRGILHQGSILGPENLLVPFARALARNLHDRTREFIESNGGD